MLQLLWQENVFFTKMVLDTTKIYMVNGRLALPMPRKNALEDFSRGLFSEFLWRCKVGALSLTDNGRDASASGLGIRS
jgi:hypothetical protein